MRRIPLASLIVFAAAGHGVQAADTPTQEVPPIFNPPAPPRESPAQPQHVMSSEMASKLASVVPKFTPAPPAETTTRTPALPAPDLDRPQNGIVHLPSYIVEEKKIPRMSERDLRTPKARVDLALKRHPGFRFGPLAFLNQAVALQFLEWEDAQERAKEMADLYGLMNIREPGQPGPAVAKK